MCQILTLSRNGASVEDIEEDMNVARRRLKIAEKELKEMLALNKVRVNSFLLYA